MGDEGDHIFWNDRHIAEYLILKLLVEDGHPGFEIRRLDVCGESPLAPGDQAVVQPLEFLRGLVGGDHDLFPVLEQVFQDVENLFLSAFHLSQSLHIIQQQDIILLVLLPHGFGVLRLDGHRELVEEVVDLQIRHLETGMASQKPFADANHQMGLA